MADEAKLHSLIHSTFEMLVMRCMWLGIVAEKNLTFSVDQCQLQALQFLVHLIDLLSVLLRYNGVFLHSESRSGSDGWQATCSDHDFSLVQVWLWEVLCSFFLVQPLTC